MTAFMNYSTFAPSSRATSSSDNRVVNVSLIILGKSTIEFVD